MATGSRWPVITGRDIAGPVVTGPPRPAASRWLGVPALVLVGGVLGVPIVITLTRAVRTGDGGIGPDNFVALFNEPDARRALLNTLGWVLIAVVVSAIALAIAVLSRRVRRPAAILLVALIAPLGVSALVVGVGFRLIFDSSPHRSTATALVVDMHDMLTDPAPHWTGPAWLTPGLIWMALVSAFAWAWIGFAVSLFRRGLDAVPDDLLRMARAEGVSWTRRQLTIVLPLLRPALAVVVLTLVVAALRLFDLILIMVPGSVQDDVNVVAVQWWRARGNDGQAAALATLLFAAVAVVALTALAGLRGWGEHRAARHVGARASSRAGRRLGIALAAVVAAGWLFPMLVLLATALHSPGDSAVSGWWQSGRDGIGIESFGEAFDAGLGAALGSTAVLATTATALVLFCAVPAAYLLAWGDLPRLVRRGAIVALTMLAAAPVPLYADPLAERLAELGLAGTRAPLIIVHAAAGVPIAILLLRTAFAAAPVNLLAETRAGQAGQWRAMDRVRRHGVDSLVAVAVLGFLGVWNDFTLGLLVSGPTSSPLTIVLWGQAKQFGPSAGPVAAGAVVSAVVPVVVVLLTWRRVVDGLTGASRRTEREAP